MKTITIFLALTFSVMFLSTSFAEERYVCDGWNTQDGSGHKTKFGLKIERDSILIIENRDHPETGAKFKLTHKFKEDPIATYTHDQFPIELITLIKNEGAKDLELHKWKINSFPESGKWTREHGVDHWSGLSYSKCWSF